MKPNVTITALVALMLSQSAIAITYYVRTDGGTSTQCTGQSDTAYSGSGTGQPCAVNHPFWLLPPTGTPIFKGGDTLLIGPGEYKIGIGAPNTSSCSTSWSYECTLSTVPAGPSATNPTRILGKGWDNQTGSKPVLWGSQRIWQVLNLGGSNIELRWLDITDHSSCIFNSPDPAKRCNRSTYPYGDHADRGITASKGSNVSIKDVNVHGLGHSGFQVGGVSNWVLEDVNIRGNGFVGWDGDIGTGSSNSGTMTFRRVKIEYNGCGETYPNAGIWGCFSQDQGGYGDGLGTGSTGGDWVFEESEISHNTSDGLDLLYHNGTGTISITRSKFEGNAGNQTKMSTNSDIRNTVIIGNCDYFKGKTITETAGAAFNHCRAAGSSIAAAFNSGNKLSIVNSTVYGKGDVIVMSSGSTCNGTEKLVSRNSIFVGDWDYTSGSSPTEKAAFYYAAGAGGNGDGACGQIKMDNQYGVVYNVKNSQCPNSNSVLCIDPLLQGPLSGDSYGMQLQSNSPANSNSNLLSGALVLGSSRVPANDILGNPRPSTSITWGAYESDSAAPIALKPPTNLRFQ